MKAREIRVGDIVEIDYITEYAKEHINEGKALVIWKGFNNQPLVRKLDTKAAIWTCYEHIARVVGHIDIVGYMDRALSAEPCDDCISRQAAKLKVARVTWDDGDSCYDFHDKCVDCLDDLPPVTPKEKTAHWINKTLIYKAEAKDERDCYAGTCSACGGVQECWNYCSGCGARMQEVSE